MRLRSVNWGEGDELPNCFLERSLLGRSLPCAIRLRAQRSDHMAVVCVARLTPARLGVTPINRADHHWLMSHLASGGLDRARRYRTSETTRL